MGPSQEPTMNSLGIAAVQLEDGRFVRIYSDELLLTTSLEHTANEIFVATRNNSLVDRVNLLPQAYYEIFPYSIMGSMVLGGFKASQNLEGYQHDPSRR